MKSRDPNNNTSNVLSEKPAKGIYGNKQYRSERLALLQLLADEMKIVRSDVYSFFH